MKFSSTQALESIKAKLGSTQKLSDRSISESLEALMKGIATEETELADFLKIAEPIITTGNVNFIKDRTDFIKDWSLQNPQQTTPITPITTPITPAPVDYTELLRKMDVISQELTGIKTKSKTEVLIQSAEGLFSAKKPDPKWKAVQDKAKAIVNTRISTETTADVLAAEYDREYNDLLSTFGGEGAYVPADNGGANTGTARDGTVEYYAAQRETMVAAGAITE
jgi:hypothetical protein